jgi:hypothetical protein
MYYPTHEIRRRLDSGKTLFTRHALARMPKRGISRSDVFEVLRRGRVTGSDFDTRHQDWTYRMTLRVSGEEIAVVVALPESNDNLIVTVF